MVDSVQIVIEDLAQSLRRSVAVDDADLNLLASSTHFDDADDARVGSLVARRVEGERRDYVFGTGVRSWRTPQRMAAIPQLGAVRPRMCFPLWSRYELLGFMWVIEATPLSDEEMHLCAGAAEKVRGLLARSTEIAAEDIREIESLVLTLLSADEEQIRTVIVDLDDFGIFRDAAEFTAFAITGGERWSDPSGEPRTSVVRRALRRVQATRPSGTTAVAVSDAEAVLLMSHGTHAPADMGENTAKSICVEIARIDEALGEMIAVGVGSSRRDASEIPLSFDQAARAAEQARRRGAPYSVWGRDRLEAMLDTFLKPRIDERELPEVILRLAQLDESNLALLETYLDLGGNAIGTAERVHMHRTSVYYRLGRIADIVGLDLQDGRDRLVAHLWLKARDHV